MNTIALTDTGRQHDHNEDAVLVDELDDGYLLAVADGMGGHAAGDVASRAAMTELQHMVEQADGKNIERVLVQAARKADEEISSLAASNPEYTGMGTTLVAAVVRRGAVIVVNVGDSRAYQVGEGNIKQITDDHSFVAEMVRAGELTPEQARDHPQRNVITQSLGMDGDVEPDTFSRELEATLLLCSDGLTEEVTDSSIQQIVREADSLETAAEQLVEHANENGGSDNISVVLARR